MRETPQEKPGFGKVGIALVVLGWVALLALGAGWIVRYDRTPGPAFAAPVVEGGSERPRLVMYAHPRCPCTRASLTLLGTLRQEFPDVDMEVCLFVPEGEGESWAEGQNLELARHIAGAKVRFDYGGREAFVEGARTSGHVVLRDRGGAVSFFGGLSQGRAEAVEGSSVERARSALRVACGRGGEGDGSPAGVGEVAPSTPVFG